MLSLSWTAPTTNADGTGLTDLASYRIYLATSDPACPSASFFTVASPTTTPTSGQSLSSRVTELTAGTTYFVRVTAVDTSGNESACSVSASGAAQPDFSVTPSTTMSFGSVAIGSLVDRTFTVLNTSTTSLTGTASVGAPYSILSGGSFSLAAGASQAVTVRFRPTTSGTFAGNVNFTAGGDTISRTVTGSGTERSDRDALGGQERLGLGHGHQRPGRHQLRFHVLAVRGARDRVDPHCHPRRRFHLRWMECACSGTGTCAVTVNAATTVTANFSLAAPPPSDPPDAPGYPTGVQLGADASGVTFAFAWAAGTGATSYQYTIAFTDGTAAQQGTVTGLSLQLTLPYHSSGAASNGFICIQSVNAAGQPAPPCPCGAVLLPARPARFR